MTRRHVSFDCMGSALVGTLDEASGSAGLLIVSGGNELRCGAWGGQAELAANLAEKGFSTFRFDRRGIGDSEGSNGEFESSAADITAAIAAFRSACPSVEVIYAMGNCDAASALMLMGGAGVYGLILSNPWTIEDGAAPPPPAIVRDHYRSRLSDPAAIKRLLTGKVSLPQLFASLRDALKKGPTVQVTTQEAAEVAAPPATLLGRMAQGISSFSGPIRILIADKDRTGMIFAALWDQNDDRLRRCPDATHSFVEPKARAWLLDQVLDALRG